MLSIEEFRVNSDGWMDKKVAAGDLFGKVKRSESELIKDSLISLIPMVMVLFF